jgi:hypothetical protein
VVVVEELKMAFIRNKGTITGGKISQNIFLGGDFLVNQGSITNTAIHDNLTFSGQTSFTAETAMKCWLNVADGLPCPPTEIVEEAANGLVGKSKKDATEWLRSSRLGKWLSAQKGSDWLQVGLRFWESANGG